MAIGSHAERRSASMSVWLSHGALSQRESRARRVPRRWRSRVLGDAFLVPIVGLIVGLMHTLLVIFESCKNDLFGRPERPPLG